jgi:hypothetical protein
VKLSFNKESKKDLMKLAKDTYHTLDKMISQLQEVSQHTDYQLAQSGYDTVAMTCIKE